MTSKAHAKVGVVDRGVGACIRGGTDYCPSTGALNAMVSQIVACMNQGDAQFNETDGICGNVSATCAACADGRATQMCSQATCEANVTAYCGIPLC